MDVTIAIIAGGKSSRMGTDKSLVMIQGEPIIERILRLSGFADCDEIILITNTPQTYAYLNIPMFGDVLPGKGSLGGIYSALYYSRQPYIFALACDMPFVNPALINHMVELAQQGKYDGIVPRIHGHLEGLHAVYSKRCLPVIQSRLEQNQLKVMGFYDGLQIRYLDETECQVYDPGGLAFFNINTPDDLARAKEIVRGQVD